MTGKTDLSTLYSLRQPISGGSTAKKHVKAGSRKRSYLISEVSSLHNKSQNIFKAKAFNQAKPRLTRILVLYDTGLPNSLFIRGQGANLSWDKGLPLKNLAADQWLWETHLPLDTCSFKVLINDKQYEIGPNRKISSGATVQYAPSFESIHNML